MTEENTEGTLRDLIPEHDRETTGRGNSSDSSDDQEEQTHITIGTPPLQKKFTESEWNDVVDVIRNQFGMSEQEVMENKSNEERHRILHDAAEKINNGDGYSSQYESTEMCLVCGNAADEVGVEICGETFCVQHTAGKVKKTLDEKQENTESNGKE